MFFSDLISLSRRADCDGGSFTGNNATVAYYDGHPLYFRGERNFRAIMASLLKRGFGGATDVVFGGDSAGGQATYIHIDYVRSLLAPSANVIGIPDSGFFLPLGSYADGLQWLFTAMNSSGALAPACLADHRASGDQYRCIFSPVIAPYITTRIWPVQSQYDPAQPMAHPDDPAYVNAYGAQLLDTLIDAVIKKSPDNGVTLRTVLSS